MVRYFMVTRHMEINLTIIVGISQSRIEHIEAVALCKEKRKQRSALLHEYSNQGKEEREGVITNYQVSVWENNCIEKQTGRLTIGTFTNPNNVTTELNEGECGV